MRHRFVVLQMWSVGRLQVHGICNHWLVYREVVEALDLYLNWIYIDFKCASNIYLLRKYYISKILFVRNYLARVCKWHTYEIIILLMTY